MSINNVLRSLALTALLVGAVASSALTIGRHQGAAILGRPLEVLMPIGLDAGMDPADLCAEAEVRYGDLRLGPRLVDVQVLGAGESLRLRVRVAQPLEEPFATVQVRIGCAQKLSRRFVLLAEEPAAESLAGPTTPATVAPVATLPVDAAQSSPPPTASSSANANAAAVTPISQDAAQPARMAAGAAALAQRPAPVRSATADRPRLQLDPLAIAPLTGTSGANPAPSARPLGSASASSAANAASSALGASSPAEGNRVMALEDEVRKLQDALNRSQANTSDLRAQLVESERGRLANSMVYGLALACLLSLSLAALAWRRGAAGRPAVWWQEPAGPIGAAEDPAAQSEPSPVSPGRASGLNSNGFKSPSGVAPDPLSPSSLIATGRWPGIGSGPSTMAPAPYEFDQRQPESLAVSTLELSDIQQAAEFFIALGEDDRAIEVLRTHIETHPRTSAMPWLDLLALHHKLGRQEDFDKLRHDFEWLFKIRLPNFDVFDEDPRGLEDHPVLLARIEALWPDPAVVDLINDGIVGVTGHGASGRSLGLQAYRDLLFLHQIAQQLGSASGDAPTSSALPWSSVDRPSAAAMSSRLGAVGGRQSLDIDLDEVLAQPSSAPDPRRDRRPGSPLGPDPDELINFDLDTGQNAAKTFGRGGGRGGT